MIGRLSQFIKNKNVSVRAFEAKIKASDGMIRRAITNNTDIQAKWLIAIAENYPELNLYWLLTGKGEMLRQPLNSDTKEVAHEGEGFKTKYYGLLEKYSSMQEELQQLNTKHITLLESLQKKDFAMFRDGAAQTGG